MKENSRSQAPPLLEASARDVLKFWGSLTGIPAFVGFSYSNNHVVAAPGPVSLVYRAKPRPIQGKWESVVVTLRITSKV